MLTLAPQSFNVQPVGGTTEGCIRPAVHRKPGATFRAKFLQAKQVQVTDQEVIPWLRPAIRTRELAVGSIRNTVSRIWFHEHGFANMVSRTWFRARLNDLPELLGIYKGSETGRQSLSIVHNEITASYVDLGTVLTAGKVDAKGEGMRSDKVFEALHTLQNRYMLCQIASKATRKFHKPNTRIQDTTNDVLNRISDNERANVMADPVNAKDAQRRAA